MRIGLGGGAPTIERIIEQAAEAEAAGFATLWYPSAVLGDPLAADHGRRPGHVVDRARHRGAADLHAPTRC